MGKIEGIKEAKALIKKGKKKGHLTYDEVNSILPETVVSSEQIDDILVMLSDLNIKVVPSAEAAAVAKAEKEKAKEEPITRAVGTGDPIRFYLREMGQVPLLTRKEEVELADQIERAEQNVYRMVVSTGFMWKELKAIRQKVVNGKISPDEIVKTGTNMTCVRFLKITESVIRKIERSESKITVLAKKMSIERIDSSNRDELALRFRMEREKIYRAIDRINFRQEEIDKVVLKIEKHLGSIKRCIRNIRKIEKCRVPPNFRLASQIN